MIIFLIAIHPPAILLFSLPYMQLTVSVLNDISAQNTPVLKFYQSTRLCQVLCCRASFASSHAGFNCTSCSLVSLPVIPIPASGQKLLSMDVICIINLPTDLCQDSRQASKIAKFKLPESNSGKLASSKYSLAGTHI
ncbi:MAG: hypothetical protein HFH93_05980 [Lachnospiraceae bacterium]|nr:hypothetical protein [Lachnospiraceae bacterium]